MPITFTVHAEKGYFESHFVGPINDHEMLEAYRAFFGGSVWRPHLHELADLGDSDLSQISSEAVQKLAELSEHTLKQHQAVGTKSAIYAPRDLMYGLGRMYGMMAEQSPETVRVFRDRGEAERWLQEG